MREYFVPVYTEPDFQERYPSRPPLLWIEILSHDDRMIDVWNKAGDLIDHGVPFVWIIDPNTLESELRSRDGVPRSSTKFYVFRNPQSPSTPPRLWKSEVP